VSLRTPRALMRLLDGSRRTLAGVMLLSLAQAVAVAPTGYLVGYAFNTLIPQQRIGALFVTAGVLLALYLLGSGLGLWTRFVVLDAVKEGVTTLRTDLLARIYALPRAYFDRADLGRLHSIVVQDSERVDVFASALFGILLPAVTVSLALAVVLAALNLLLFGAVVAVVPLLVGLGLKLGRLVRFRTRPWQRAFDVFDSRTQLALRGITLTKVRAAEAAELDHRRVEHGLLGQTGRDMVRLHASYASVQNAVAATAGVVVLAVGGRAVALGEMSLGSLLAFYAILALLLRQVTVIAPILPQIHSGYESLARVEEVLALEDAEPYQGTTRIDFRGGVELEGVSFGYAEEPVLHELDLRIEAGAHIAIVGPNGAGKSTVANLVLGLYRPDEGRVLADGTAYDALDIKRLRRSFGVVLDDPIIVPGPVIENIRYGLPDATVDDVKRAAAWATADDFIENLPGGYETEVGSEGILLSAGQRQRIAIARALCGTPALLVLDEPTAHLDDAAIRRLFANLLAFPGAPTVIIISHDPEVVRYVDVVHHLRDGRLVDSVTTQRSAAGLVGR
jgi:ABC-type bacteriocin/lantibiotic exporter with double-glycine peptidase domain